jgi:hypothetical protein
MIRDMSAEAELYLRLCLAAPFAFLALLAYALVRRYRVLRTPRWVSWPAAFLLGFGLSPAFILIITSPIWTGGLVLLVGWMAWQLARGGRFGLAGMLVLGLCLPGLLWWGRLLVEDALDPLSLYEPGLVLWWLPELVGVVMAIGLVIIGDRTAGRIEVIRRPPNVARHPTALGNALQRGILFGPSSLPSLVSELCAFLVVGPVTLVASAAGLPWPLVVLGGGLLFMLIATELWYLAFPAGLRPAWEVFAFVGHAEQERWRAETRTEVPKTVKEIHAWLSRHEERPENRWARGELLAMLGRLDEARALAQRIEPVTQDDALHRAALLDYIDWIDGEELDVDEITLRAETVGQPGSQERLLARGEVAVAIARDQAERGGDWKAPLVALRDEIGTIGWEVFRQDTHRTRMVVTFLAGLVVATLALVPAGLFARLR